MRRRQAGTAVFPPGWWYDGRRAQALVNARRGIRLREKGQHGRLEGLSKMRRRAAVPDR
jgi:hypothetical protein